MNDKLKKLDELEDYGVSTRGIVIALALGVTLWVLTIWLLSEVVG